MNIQDMFPFLIISYLIQYVLISQNSLNCFPNFGSSVCQGSISWVLIGSGTWLPHGQLCATVGDQSH